MSMNNRLASYVGVTGFTAPEEVLFAWAAASPDAPFMVGVLASSTTLEGGTNSWKHRYPRREDIAGIFPEKSAWTLNLVHFNMSRAHSLGDWLAACVRWGGPNLQGVQLNIPWPSRAELEAWRRTHDQEFAIVLQVGGAAMAACHGDVRAIAYRIKEYEGLVEHVLIDGSGGSGTPLDSGFVADCFAEILMKDIDVGLGVGGGLEPGRVQELLGPVHRRFPFFSVDAEGRLRDDEDRLDIGRTVQYVREVNELFGYGS